LATDARIHYALTNHPPLTRLHATRRFTKQGPAHQRKHTTTHKQQRPVPSDTQQRAPTRPAAIQATTSSGERVNVPPMSPPLRDIRSKLALLAP
jgi:hypothetical protein